MFRPALFFLTPHHGSLPIRACGLVSQLENPDEPEPEPRPDQQHELEDRAHLVAGDGHAVQQHRVGDRGQHRPRQCPHKFAVAGIPPDAVVQLCQQEYLDAACDVGQYEPL